VSPVPRRSSSVARNEQFFEVIVERAQHELALGSIASAAAFAQLAADFASTICSRLTRSKELEELLFELAIRLPPLLDVSETHQSNGILHVLTDSSPSNARASLVARWLEADTEHQHAVALTHAEVLEGRLARVVEESAARVIPLVAAFGTLPRRAAGLRARAREYSTTLLHTTPFDIVPALAFGTSEHEPVALVDAGLDGFRVDRWIANLLLVSSMGALRANREFHRIRPGGVAVLPTPMAAERRKHLRRDARRSLNLAEDSIATLVFANFNGAAASAVISEVKGTLPNYEFLVVSDSQGTGHIEDDGDARCIHLRDTSGPGLWDAVDIVLDLSRWLPTPLVLRAANRGLPVVLHRSDNDGIEAALEQHEQLRTVLITARSDRELSGALNELRDPTSRSQRGAALQALVRGIHTGPGWRDAWDVVWHRLLATDARSSILSDNDGAEVMGLWFESVSQNGGFRSCVERQRQLVPGSLPTCRDPPDGIFEQAIDWVIELVDARTALDATRRAVTTEVRATVAPGQGERPATKVPDLEPELNAVREELEFVGARLADLQSEHAILRAGVDGILASGSYRLVQGIAAITSLMKQRKSRDRSVPAE
jgi:hypothetical protein